MTTFNDNKPLVKISHVIFDMDGLILDTETRYDVALERFTKQHGHEYTLDLKSKIMGRTGIEEAEIIVRELALPMRPEECYKLVDAEYSKVFSEYVPPMPGAVRLIKHLHAHNVQIAVATSSKRFTFNLKTKPHQELFSLFHHILVASDDPDVTRGKPDPQTFLVCASRFDNPPTEMSNVLVLEDSPAGVQAANAAGMRSVWIPDPRLPKDSALPFVTFASLEEFNPQDFGLPSY